MTAREREVLELIRKDPGISYAEIASALGISRSTVAVYIASLTSQGEIIGKQYVLAENVIACIGSCCADIYGFTGEESSGEGGAVKLSSGGVARNIGENLSRLGDSVKLFSVVGDDRLGQMIQKDSAASGMDIADLGIIQGMDTPAFLQLIGPDGEPTATVAQRSPRAVPDIEYLREKEHLIKNARVILVCGLPAASIQYIHDRFPEKRMFADLGAVEPGDRVTDCLSCFHSVQANKREAEAITGVRIRNDDTLNRAADILIRRGVHRVVITLGVDGAFYKDADGLSLRRHTMPISHVVNATGAGDAFAAGYIHCLLADRSPVYALDFGMACAVLALSSGESINRSLCVPLAEQMMEKYPAQG